MRFIFTKIFLLFFLFLVFTPRVSAADLATFWNTDYTKTLHAGILPTSTWYFLDQTWEGITSFFFSFTQGSRFSFHIKSGAERLAEMNALASDGEIAFNQAQDLNTAYRHDLEEALKNANGLKKNARIDSWYHDISYQEVLLARYAANLPADSAELFRGSLDLLIYTQADMDVLFPDLEPAPMNGADIDVLIQEAQGNINKSAALVEASAKPEEAPLFKAMVVEAQEKLKIGKEIRETKAEQSRHLIEEALDLSKYIQGKISGE